MSPSLIKISFVLAGLILIFSTAFKDSDAVSDTKDFYGLYLDSLDQSTQMLEQKAATANAAEIQQIFKKIRFHYKKIEFITEYSFPKTAAKINGIPIPESSASEPGETEFPTGLQVLEPVVFGKLDMDARKAIQFEISNVKNGIEHLKSTAFLLELTDAQILDAIRLNIYRMMIKGIAGFDAPVALTGISEAESVLQSSKIILSFFPESEEVRGACDKAINYIHRSPEDFNAFDRAHFIQKYINNFCISLYNYQQAQHIPFVLYPRAISAKAKYLFAPQAFDPMFFAPSGTEPLSSEKISLGERLFKDAALSFNGSRSCASCHKPEKAFTDGLIVNESIFEGRKLLRNTPTLWNVAFQPAQFYDSRTPFLEEQVHEVISNKAEMNGSLEIIAAKLNKNSSYRKQFEKAYQQKRISPTLIRKAVAGYVRSLIAFNTPFDRFMRGEETAMNKEEIAGFNLFMGKARCGSCHFIPLTSGAVPPLYEKIESEVLGVPALSASATPRLDADSGKFHLYKIKHHLHSFKTPGLRNVALTAPYMHNGVFKTLEEVVNFYNEGGGAGLGFDLPNQTLAPDKLNLTDEEKKRVIAFLNALTER